MSQVLFKGNLEHNNTLYEAGKIYEVTEDLVAQFGPAGLGNEAILHPVSSGQPVSTAPEAPEAPAEPAEPAEPVEAPEAPAGVKVEVKESR